MTGAAGRAFLKSPASWALASPMPLQVALLQQMVRSLAATLPGFSVQAAYETSELEVPAVGSNPTVVFAPRASIRA